MNIVLNSKYKEAKVITDAFENQDYFELSLYVMLSNHTFYKIKSKSFDDIYFEVLKFLTKCGDNYCSLTNGNLIKNNIEFGNVGKMYHQRDGIVDVLGWIDDLKKDLQEIKYKII